MSKKINKYEPKTYKVSQKTDYTNDTFILKVPCSMHPKPGQFVEVSIMGIGECPISVCSYSKHYIELLIKNVGNVTGKIAKLKKGNQILIRGPYGHGYPMKDIVGKNIIIIAGGTGTAPPRSVIEYVEKNRDKFNKIFLFFGFRDPTEILFKEDIEKWSKQFNVNLCVDKCDNPDFNGKVGFVTDIFAGSEFPQENSAVLLCGPPIMMKIAIEKLKSKGFLDNQIYLSFERHMKCGVGKCGHCVVAGKYMCKDGPVFSYDEARDFYD